MTHENSKKAELLSRRAMIMISMKLSFVTVLFGRLFYLQFIKYNNYKTLSENNRTKINIVIPLRGKIYDRNGLPVADNRKIYRLIYDKEGRHDTIQIVKKIMQVLHFSDEESSIFLKRIYKSKLNQVVLYEELNWAQVSQIEENAPDLPGVSIDIGYYRIYPEAAKFSHVVGYIGGVSNNETNTEQLHPDIKVGKSGIEKLKDISLRGKAGIKKYEVNAKGSIIQELSLEKSIAGESLSLSIDNRIQSYMYDLIENESAAAVVMDIKTGELLSLVSTPSFNPNQFVQGISNEDWGQIVKNPYLPLTNKAISNDYPPGSSFKMIVSLAAMKNGFDPYKEINCTGVYPVGNRNFHCWKRTGHGYVNMFEALMQSCNCYIYELAKFVGMDKISETAQELGLGSKSMIELPREHTGSIPKKELFMNILNKKWQLGDTLNCSIGQGLVSASPLQLTLMTARIASGLEVVPTIYKMEEEKEFPKLSISEKYLEVVRKGMFMVVNRSKGTAYSSRVMNSFITIAGKTSTSQVISKRRLNEDLSRENVDRKYRNHGLFVGYGPYDNPAFATCVLIEHAGTPKKAIKIANKILLEACRVRGYHT